MLFVRGLLSKMDSLHSIVFFHKYPLCLQVLCKKINGIEEHHVDVPQQAQSVKRGISGNSPVPTIQTVFPTVFFPFPNLNKAEKCKNRCGYDI